MYSNLLLHSITPTSIVTVTVMLFLWIVICYISTYIYKKGEDIVSLFMNVKELEYNKQYRTSLFKITHEIKNPIAVCKSYLDMFDINNKDHGRFIPIIKGEINKILLLLKDFLAMNKIQINKELLDVVLLLEDNISQLEPLFKENKISIQSELIDDEIFIQGDYNRLSQVLINILKNAIEASSSKITIKMKIVQGQVKITFQDNGEGMSSEVLKRVKEPFFTTKKDGTGLGISLSSEIIEAHKGIIQYHSKEHNGTKVEIMLPLSKLIC